MTETVLDPVTLATQRDELRLRLAREFHVVTLLVPVKTVAAILGLSPTTIYAYIRNGAFSLPYRRVNKTPLIAVDDLIDWLLGQQVAPPRNEVPMPKAPPSLVASAPRKASAEDSIDRAVADAMSQLGRPAKTKSGIR
ncbi:helix-turn-helix domain-containing protein [Massilia psychrophila]|uniref:Helix-turn-helix domain-containing protein n=1 Tax=Massilia psychrophila TaxID=1603353 RepID=A0A2G8T0I1_9BURK|nr:helix-turn-helix domain-containing protein [Massilia psychrophila]PIL39208.1 hypothetical protein CR103_14065 [Massilia psychrophila]GGE82016.1 hypothetical protein GCM10008020_28680 [Massilia psychrophila]